MILRLPCAVANPTSIASMTNATPPTALFAPHPCRKTAALKANKIRNLFYFIEFLFLSPPIAAQYGVGYAYCPMGNTATQLAPIAAQYGARALLTALIDHFPISTLWLFIGLPNRARIIFIFKYKDT